uniref:Uncharacterized protein n=1 Tax=Arundo donax TaxID=35708 RepID=A0A0A9GTG9_ARUDO
MCVSCGYGVPATSFTTCWTTTSSPSCASRAVSWKENGGDTCAAQGCSLHRTQQGLMPWMLWIPSVGTTAARG